MDRYVCIHGHFYQPPRQNPWLEAVELQESAHPYHDWNERITAECYGPNARSRILDDQGRILKMVNNYAKMSFNVGPTLLAWLEKNAPEVYEAILQADVLSQANFSGHGSALAQGYHHMILPLANRRDKQTQILWGIKDFEHRFGRKPEGMWLPETAVDLETLDLLAERSIGFTILGQHQAKKVRPIGAEAWQEVEGAKIDPSMAYEIRLPSDRKMALFFYDGAISRAVAFETLLSSGESFVRRLMEGFSEWRSWPQLVHLATDGESYGHHHHFGEMALAYALNTVEAKGLARLTNYGQFLEKHPPTYEVQIIENTSWSCFHGVERWRKDCGCHSAGHPGWNQEWRKPLRETLDWLRDECSPLFEDKGRTLFKDPWEARNAYIEVLLERSRAAKERFFSLYGARPLSETEKAIALKLMELQRHVMLMYTSCGWFYDDLSGIETVQILQYAARALHLAEECFESRFEPGFLEHLSRARSNLPEEGDGRKIYERAVKPAWADLSKVGAHYAISSLFREEEVETPVSCYRPVFEDYQLWKSGKARCAAGRLRISSEITLERGNLTFAVLHLGDHTVICGVRDVEGDEVYEAMVKDVSNTFNSADFPETIRTLDRHFGKGIYSLRSLFRDEQKRILDILLEATLAEAETVYRKLYETHAVMMRFLKDSRSPIPRALYLAAEYVLNADLQRAFAKKESEPAEIQDLIETARRAGITLHEDGLEYALRKKIEAAAEAFHASPSDLPLLEELERSLSLCDHMPFRVTLWAVQNDCYDLLQTVYPERVVLAEQGDRRAREWVDHFVAIGERLSLKVP